jgi:hypothetical protein
MEGEGEGAGVTNKNDRPAALHTLRFPCPLSACVSRPRMTPPSPPHPPQRTLTASLSDTLYLRVAL